MSKDLPPPPSQSKPPEKDITEEYKRAKDFVQIIKNELNSEEYPDIEKNDSPLVRIVPHLEDFLILLKEKKEIGLLSTEDVERIEKAIGVMMRIHLDQKDRADGSGPFIKHPMKVAKGVLSTYEGEDLASVCIAALLHDAVEDQAKLVRILHGKDNKDEIEKANNHEEKYFALEELGNIFGYRVKELIEKVSTPLSLLGADLTEESNREKYFNFIKKIVNDTEDPAIFVIKWQDARDNMLTIGDIYKRIEDIQDRWIDYKNEKYLRERFKIEVEKKRKMYIKLHRKYEPVLRKIFLPAFQNLKENHPLFKYKEQAIKDINKALDTQYIYLSTLLPKERL